MVRRTISLVLVLSVAITLVGVSPSAVRSGTGNGDVDPTGIDNGHRILSTIPDRDTPAVGLRDIAKSDAGAARWIEMFYLRMLLRSLGF